MPVTIVGNNTPTAGGVVYGDGANYASTPVGASGQALLSSGTGVPTWGNVQPTLVSGTNIKTINGTTVLGSGNLTVGGGAWELLNDTNIGNVRTHNFTGLSGRFGYQLVVCAKSSTGFTASSVTIRIGTGTATTSSYYWGGVNSNGASITGAEQDDAAAFFPFGTVQDLSNSYTVLINAELFQTVNMEPTFQCRANGYGSANNTQFANTAGVNLALSTFSSIHLDLGSTSFAGRIYLLGAKNV